jgi:hypothetical protein
MNAVALFLHWLATYASCHVWLAEVGQAPGPLRIAYGGNFVDAYHVAQSLGGWITEAA